MKSQPHPDAQIDQELTKDFVDPENGAEEESKIWIVNIETLADLLELQESVKDPLIIVNNYQEWWLNRDLPTNLPCIEIYDSWRE